jgi:hypothetical protein
MSHQIKIICAKCGKDRAAETLAFMSSDGNINFILTAECDCVKPKKGETDDEKSSS